MLRVGLTGDLGSGKSTVAAMLAEHGAVVMSSDAMAQALMQPGEAVYAAIVAAFGPGVVAADGTLDRGRLAALAFDPEHPRAGELNAIVHPAVIAAQQHQVAEYAGTHTIVVVESALIFTAVSDVPLRERFDRVLLVVAPEEQKIARFVARQSAQRTPSAAERAALETDARRRLALQRNDVHGDECRVVRNDGNLVALSEQVEMVWKELVALEGGGTPPPVLA